MYRYALKYEISNNKKQLRRASAEHVVHNKYVFFFSPSRLLYSPFVFSLPPINSRITQIRGHIAGSSPPHPTTVRALHFYREKILALSSLVDSRRTVLTHASRSQQLIPFFIFANKFRISPRRDSNSRTNTSSIRWLSLDHRGDGLTKK